MPARRLSILGLLSALSLAGGSAHEALAQPIGHRPVDLVAPGGAPGTTDKIVGGKEAAAGRYPFQVALIKSDTAQDDELNGQFCGGSLIDRNWVLTAAHCVPNTTEKEVDIYVGSHLLANGASTGATRIHVRRIISHKDFDGDTFENDVALIQLMTPAPETLKPVTLSTPQSENTHASDGKTLTVIGWGRVSEGGPRSSRLMEVDLPVQPRATCETNYKAVDPRVNITTNMFCAGVPQGGKDSCKGDSGGYIGAPIDAATFVQLGIVSWGFGCARPTLFGVYTRLANYHAWVREVLKTF